MGVDNDEFVCEVQNPPLTSINIATAQAGFQAAKLLDQLIKGTIKMEGQQIVAKATGVIRRMSTDTLMVKNENVRKALQYIRENSHRPILVSDVVGATNLGHRALNEQFQATLNCSISKQLTNTRINLICQLLANSQMKIKEVAEAMGYEEDRHFSRYFKRVTGETPLEYRRKINLP